MMKTARKITASVTLLAGLMLAGCSHPEAVTPPPGTLQTQQQIQADPNLPDAVKRVRMQNSSQMSGPPVHRPGAMGQ